MLHRLISISSIAIRRSFPCRRPSHGLCDSTINPDKGFWPEQIDFHYVNRKSLERTLGRKAEYHLRQSSDGIWYPEEIVYKSYLNGQPDWEDHVRFLDFQINIDVSDKLRIEIPPGTPIVDHRLGEGQSKVVAP